MRSINKKLSFLSLVLLFVMSNACRAQQQHFIYIQSDNKQPFYVKLDSRILSSTSSGYAIIPKLPKANMEMQIGFPKNEFPPQNIYLNVQEDAGFSLKNFGEGKWGLFNLQTMQIVYANDKNVDKTLVVNSPKAIKEIEKEQQVEPNPAPKEASIANTKNIVDDNPLPIVDKGVSQVSNSAENISKTKEENETALYKAVYRIKAANSVDYVDVVIEKVLEQENIPPATVIKDRAILEQPKTQVADNKTISDQKFLDMELPNPNRTEAAQVTIIKTDTATQNSQKPASEKKLSVNSDCMSIAGEDDFFNTRKAMVAKRTDEAMIVAAVKILKKKCYSSEQIKGLGAILLDDTGRLEFFRQAYPFVSDPQNFEALSAAFDSNELKTAFKAFLDR